ncbi:hypothetical protein NDU88_000684 [Pleurodeles waltl]|uniref:Uncharacterized protein n=1 Tax=Pleurodeles waltl TaxID=8319 RepID=A0AAV7WLF1_PLEWA|nr:hypothetical protein NDU88_000684 [Pleurodeles waltl]
MPYFGRVGQNVDHGAGEHSRAELLQTIQDSRQALENKIETVAIEINLLRTDLRKVSDNVCIVEGSIEQLQIELATLKKQVVVMEHWLDMWDKEPKEHNPAWRNGARRRAMKVSYGRGTRSTSETAVRQSPERTEIGIVEIQADGTMALAASGQRGAAEAPSSMQEEVAIQEKSGADEGML